MKRVGKILLAAVLILAAVMIGLKMQREHQPSESQSLPAPTVQKGTQQSVEESTDQAEDVDEQVGSLSTAELKPLEDLFNQADANGLLLSTYADASQIDLSQLFYNGTDSNTEVTEQERKLYAQAMQIEKAELDMTKVTTSQADAYLSKWLGVDLTEMLIGLPDYSGWVYLEEYDAFYFLHGDTNYQKAFFVSGERSENNQLIIRYTLEGSEETRELTLKDRHSSYLVLSNTIVVGKQVVS